MSFKNIEGHKRELEIIKKTLKNNRLSHAYLLSGKEGIGKKKIAFEIIKYLNCLNRDLDECESCNECINCVKMNHKNKEDYFFINPIEGKIKIDQVRNLSNRIFYKSVDDGYKFVLIDDCEKITIEAANSLLKLIEEPPHKTCFFLITGDEEKVIKTIKSRCQKISFTNLTKENLCNLIKNTEYNIQNNDFILDFSEGSFGNLIKYLEDASFAEDVAEFDKILIKIENKTYTELIELSKNFDKDRKKLFLFMEYLMYHLEKAIKGNTEILKLSNYFEINDIIDKIIEAKQMLDRNISPRFICENLLIKIKLILKG